jgi:hypothetical protein
VAENVPGVRVLQPPLSMTEGRLSLRKWKCGYRCCRFGLLLARSQDV